MLNTFIAVLPIMLFERQLDARVAHYQGGLIGYGRRAEAANMFAAAMTFCDRIFFVFALLATVAFRGCFLRGG